MAEAMPGWRETPGSASFYHESGLLLTAEKDTTAESYVSKSLANVKAQRRAVKVLRDKQAISEGMQSSLARATGDIGYLNRQAGWADAAGAIGWLWEQVAAAARTVNIRFVRKPVKRLVFSQDGKTVQGAETGDGVQTLVDLTVLACGAWTPAMIPLDGIASARGQVIGYMDLTEGEAHALRDVPVHFNMSKGCFFFPPTRKESGGWETKVARHAFGYSTKTSVPEFPDRLPPADYNLLVDFLKSCLTSVDVQNRHLRPRFCYYLDTASSNFIASMHPDFGQSLYVATGGSGHGFKFLPVLGERLADVLDGSDYEKNGGKWTRKWSWPSVQRDPNGSIVTKEP
ncbi:MAG: hypothetical protein Q9159_007452 [Coniocarpon cinnabarinum]